MKKIFAFIVILLAAKVSFGQIVQTRPSGMIYQGVGNTSTWYQVGGVLYPVLGVASGSWADTAAMNLNPFIKNIPGFQARTANRYWVRSDDALKWNEYAFIGGSGVGTVTNVSALTLGTTGTDLSSTVANSTTTPVITLNVPTASALNRGALSAADWITFNSKGVGTVTSVGLSLPSIFTVSGSPVTGSGTLTGTFNTQTANTFFGGPSSGGAATPTFRAIVAGDLPGTSPYTLQQVTDVGANSTNNLTHDVYYIQQQSFPGAALPAGYTAVGTPTYAVSGGKINFSSTGSITFTKYVRSDLGVLSDHNTIEATLTLGSAPSTTTQGIAVGYQSYSANCPTESILGGLITKSDDANYGKSYIYDNYTAVYQYSATANTDINNGDVIRVSFIKNGWNLTMMVRNFTQDWELRQNVVVTNTVTPILAGSNSAYPTIYHLGGSFSVDSFHYTVNAPTNTDIVVVGNSMVFGQAATTSYNRFVELIGDSRSQVISAGGGCDISGEILNRISEIISIRPKKVLLHDIAGNDILFGVASGTWQANLLAIRDSLANNGIEVIWTNGQPRTATNETAQKTFIEGEATFKGDLIIDSWNALLGTGTAVASKYSSDGTHLNNTGMGVLANTINTALGANPQNTINGGLTVDGLTIGLGRTNVANNTVFGLEAGYSTTTGQYNLALGWKALRANLVSDGNTAVGTLTLNNTTGQYNTAVGMQSLYTNSSGGNNVAVGLNALLSNTTASNNVAVGSNALSVNVTGTSNVAVGTDALKNSTGSTNTAIGHLSNDATSNTGIDNTSVGYLSLSYLTSGNKNTAIGAFNAAITTGSGNSFLGYGINMNNFLTGSNNTAIGYLNFQNATSASGNIAIGYSAGKYVTTGANEVFINSIDRTNYAGDQTESPIYIVQNATVASQTIALNGVTTATNGVIVGGGATASTLRFLEPSGSGTNYSEFQAIAQAGNITYSLPPSLLAGGVLTDVAGNGVLTWAAAGGASTWNAITDPTGDQALTFGAGESSTWTDQNTTEDLFTVNNATSTTNSLFSYNRTSTALAAGNNISEFLSSGANGTNAITATGLSVSVTNTNATSGTNVGINVTASGATTNNYAALFAGRVGINVAAPLVDLELPGGATANSTLKVGSIESQSYGVNNSWIADNIYFVTSAYKYRVNGYGVMAYYGIGVGDYAIYTAPSGTAGASATMTERFIVKNTGNVGIGVTGPTAVLHLKAGTTAASTAPMKFTSGTNLTTAEAGATEYDGKDLFFTPAGTIRKVIPTVISSRSVAQSAAVASVAVQTVGASDASYFISANVLVTTSSAEAFTVTVAYTDESNTARTQTMPFILLAGTTVAAINFANGAAPYEGLAAQIRCKASTTITVATTGTFTGCTYNVEGTITKIQ